VALRGSEGRKKGTGRSAQLLGAAPQRVSRQASARFRACISRPGSPLWSSRIASGGGLLHQRRPLFTVCNPTIHNQITGTLTTDPRLLRLLAQDCLARLLQFSIGLGKMQVDFANL